jgi:hypothetical protein
MVSETSVYPLGADPHCSMIQRPLVAQPQSPHTTMGHFTFYDRRACHAQNAPPRCRLAEGLTGHSADVAGCPLLRRDDYGLETLRDVSKTRFTDHSDVI